MKMDIAELSAWLETDEAASREGRARRLRHLLEAIQPPKEDIYFQVEASFHSFNEVRLAYIHGLYLATVLLSLACIEREVAGRLYAEGWEEAKGARLKELLSKAHERGIISDAESDTFRHLRSVRNSYAHFKPPGHSSSLVCRALHQNVLPNEVMMIDAQRAVEALGSFFERRPRPVPKLGPLEIAHKSTA